MMFHQFSVQDAVVYGERGAILIHHFRLWIGKNRANGRHQYDGHTWTYNSTKAFTELFPYLSEKQVRRALEKLIEAGVIMTGNYNENPWDKTLWYAFSDESRYLDNDVFSDVPKRAHGGSQRGKCTSAQTGNSSIDSNYKPSKHPHTPTGSDRALTQQSTRSKSELDEQALTIYAHYPRKVAKPAAVRAIKKALKTHDFNYLLDRTRRYSEIRSEDVAAGDDKRFTPHPSTWFNQERYNDEEETWRRVTTTDSSHANGADNTGGAITGDRNVSLHEAWWLLTTREAQARAAKQGLRDWQRRWSIFTDNTGSFYWVEPQNERRPVPAGVRQVTLDEAIAQRRARVGGGAGQWVS